MSLKFEQRLVCSNECSMNDSNIQQTFFPCKSNFAPSSEDRFPTLMVTKPPLSVILAFVQISVVQNGPVYLAVNNYKHGVHQDMKTDLQIKGVFTTQVCQRHSQRPNTVIAYIAFFLSNVFLYPFVLWFLKYQNRDSTDLLLCCLMTNFFRLAIS